MPIHRAADPSYDVVVVGARAAGAATAYLLARSGLRILLVDRGRYGTDTLSTHALMRGGVLQLSRWGLLEKIIAAGTPPVRRATFRYADAVVPVIIKPSHGVDALYAPRRTVLDPILVDAAFASGADVRFGIAVADVDRDRHGAVTGVAGRTRDGQAFRARARIIVGADGIRSTIAERAGAPFERVGTSAAAVTYGYWSGLQTDGYEWNFRPDAASGVIPTNDGQACVFASASPRRIGRGGLEPLTQIVTESSADLADRLADAMPPRALRTFSGRPGHMRRSWGPGWALVGDAGYFKDPLGAHGLTDALRDAELLARGIIAVIDGADERDALARFQVTRDALSTALFDVMNVIAGHRWTGEEIPSLLLQLNAAMADEVQALAALPPLPPPIGSAATRTPFGRSQDGQRLPGYRVPAAQVPDGLAVFPFDGVFEQVGKPPAGGDAGDVGDPAAGPDRDDEPLVVEGECLRRPAVQLRGQVAGHRLALLQRHLRQRGQHVPGARVGHRGEVARGVDVRVVQHAQVPVDLDAAVVAGRQRGIGHHRGCFQPTRPDEHAALHQLAVGEPEAVVGRGGDRRAGADLDPEVSQDGGGLAGQLR
jgi:2-polyprenyl-6-methoxyphenol hydroxylase-like FAD-dependent oxidoreductase